MNSKNNDTLIKRNSDINNKMENNINHIYKTMKKSLSKKELLEMLQKQSQLLAQKDEQIAEQKKVIESSIPKPPAKLPKIRKQKPVVIKKKSADESDEMKDIKKSFEDKELKSETDKITMRYNKLFRKSEVITYPKKYVSIDRLRREETSIASDAKDGSSFVNLFKKRLESIKGNKETVSMTLNVDITDENENVTEEKTYGPFVTEIPKLSKNDMYKFMVYTLMENKFNPLSGQISIGKRSVRETIRD